MSTAEQAVIEDSDIQVLVAQAREAQAIFEASPDVLFVSSHQMPLYPGTGCGLKRCRPAATKRT